MPGAERGDEGARTAPATRGRQLSPGDEPVQQGDDPAAVPPFAPGWIDTHCHLDAAEFDPDRAELIGRAAAAGVGAVVIPAVEPANFGAVAACARACPGGAYALGIHPLYTGRAREEDLADLRLALEAALAVHGGDPRLVAVGEIGLDHFVPELNTAAARARQEWFFVEQLKLAKQLGLPVLLHVRRALDPILGALRRVGVAGGIAHAFNGSRQQADAYVALGFALGFGGAMTFARALQIRRLAAGLPERALVVETDAPDIPPEWLGRGRPRNTHAELPAIGAVLAQLRGAGVADTLRLTSGNACRVLPRLGALLSTSKQ